MKKSLMLVALTLIATIGLVALAAQATVLPVYQESLTNPRIFAYRSWQSVGVRVREGDEVRILAQGTWLYTPGEYHGPEGHRRYSSPAFYPLPNVPGGALIGRIGEDGEPFYVGQRVRWRANESGPLYLRIDDDILSDNDGWVAVEVMVITPTPPD
ncbi:MAG: hypothetical protein DRJ03_03165 [Chloroflexi bacterium]|nr:MAG: hypothetical protein DRI81_12725 [Chloroflexota bacterium]RLC88340.1 MAG: hypothetical protein DRJ03_03165 [Chloroflexota bacterium]HEY71845.1 hypothetical protein [Thermoflexia bacterium]